MSTTDVDLGSELVVQAARLVRALRRDHALPAGMRVLSLLDEHGPSTVTALADLDGCAQPTMSTALRRLGEQGLVERHPHPEDARSSVASLSARGHDELAAVRRTNGADVAARLAAHPGHTSADLATAVAVLRDVLAAPDPGRTP